MMQIETERLRLYPLSQAQMEAAISAEADAELRAAFTQMLEGCLRHPEQWNWYAMWRIELKDGTPVGDLCFKGLDADGVAEIGYGLLTDFHGRGYATEAVLAVLAWAFRQPELSAVEAEAAAYNAASLRVLEKCGFTANGKTGEEGPRYRRERSGGPLRRGVTL